MRNRISVDEKRFVSESREAWQRLEEAVVRARSAGVAKLGPEALRQLHEDYRRSAADLAYAQTHFPSTRTEAYLNQLVGRAHAELYGATPQRLARVLRFLASGYPRLVRANWRTLAVAAALLLGAVATGFLLAHINYPLARLFLPEQLRDLAADEAIRGTNAAQMLTIAPAVSALITANNIQVSLVAFAGGVTFGALTTYALLTNGMLLGVLAGVFAKAGASLEFWALIVPHGALELPAIVLAGCSGLMLAKALLFPGDLPRATALRNASGDAVRVVLGGIPLLVIAGFIEGFVTPLPIDPALKLALGATLAALLGAYLLFAGSKTSSGLDLEVAVHAGDGEGRRVDIKHERTAGGQGL